MSESTVARSNQFLLTGSQQTDFEPQAEGSASRLQASQSQAPQHHLNLRDALDWLLCGAHHDEDELSHEDKASRRHRRMDLLMWLLNLEPRLAPYGE